jgi:hypothetical protein
MPGLSNINIPNLITMKNNLRQTIILILFLAFSLNLQAQNTGFTGEWKLNREKTTLGENRLIMSGIKITLKNDTLFTTRTYDNGNGEEYPFDENVSLNGNECKIVIYEMPRTAKATLSGTDGTLNFVSTTTFYGNNGEENLVTTEKWNLDSEGKILTMVSTSKMSAGEFTGTFYYDKVK